jgi:hypothetical protein
MNEQTAVKIRMLSNEILKKLQTGQIDVRMFFNNRKDDSK